MTLHMTTRVPVNKQYSALVGKAVYVFAYYEWIVIWLVEKFEPGFVARYSRGKPMTSGGVLVELKRVIANAQKAQQQELQTCCDTFESMIEKRNALIHAHPSTDVDGKQILTYQAALSRSLPDMKWPASQVEKVITEFDAAACDASLVLEKTH